MNALLAVLYDRSYGVQMAVKTTANTTGLLGPAVLTTSEATWNVPKGERKSSDQGALFYNPGRCLGHGMA